MKQITFALFATLAFSAAAVSQPHRDKEPPPTAPMISVVPFDAKPAAAPSIASVTVNLAGREFELLTLTGFTGKATWDVTGADGGPIPVKWFQAKPGTPVIGYRIGQSEPGNYVTPETPTVAVFAAGNGKAVVTCWGVGDDGSPKKLATVFVESVTTAKDGDPFAAKVRGAWLADGGKADLAKSLASVYAGMAKAVDSYKTTGALNKAFVTVRTQYVDVLPRLVNVLADEQDALTGRDPAHALDRDRAAEHFGRVAKALAALN